MKTAVILLVLCFCAFSQPMITPADTQDVLQTTGYHVKLCTHGSTDAAQQYFGAWQGSGCPAMSWNYCQGYAAGALKLPPCQGSLSMVTVTDADSAWLRTDYSIWGKNDTVSVCYSIYFWADVWGYCLKDLGRYYFHNCCDRDRALIAIDRLKKFAGWYSHKCRHKCAILSPVAQVSKAASATVTKAFSVNLLGRGVKAGGNAPIKGLVIVNGEKRIRW